MNIFKRLRYWLIRKKCEKDQAEYFNEVQRAYREHNKMSEDSIDCDAMISGAERLLKKDKEFWS